MRVVRDRAAVGHRLAVVFAGVFEFGDLEQAEAGGVEAGLAEQGEEGRVGDRQRTVTHQARIGEAGGARQAHEVVPVEGAAEAFAVEHRIAAHRVGEAAVGIHVGEIELASRPQQAPHALQHGGFVCGEVEHAVGWRPSEWCKSPGPQPGVAGLSVRTSGDRLHGWRCKGWAGPFPWCEYHLNQTDHA